MQQADRPSDQAEAAEDSSPFTRVLASPFHPTPSDNAGEALNTPFGVIGDDPASLDALAARWVRGLGVREAKERAEAIASDARAFAELARGRLPDAAVAAHAAVAARIVFGLRDRIEAHAAASADFVRGFVSDANAVAAEMLRESRAKLDQVRDVYGVKAVAVPRGRPVHVARDNEATRSLRDGARELESRRAAIAALEARIEAAEQAAPESGIARAAPRLRSRLELEQRDFAARVAELGRAHPVLVDALLPSAKPDMLAKLGGSVADIAVALSDYDGHARAAIDAMEARRADHPEDVLRLAPVIEATKTARQIDPSSLGASYVDHEARAMEQDRAFADQLATVAAVALSVAAAMPSGGTSLLVISALSVGADAAIFARSAGASAVARDAASTDPAKERALSVAAPGAGGLIVQAIGVVIGSAGVLSALAKSRFARLLAEEGALGDAARKVDAQIRRAYAETLFARLGADRFASLTRDLPGDVLEKLVERHTPETIAWALRDLPPSAACEVLERFDAKVLDAVSQSMCARALRSASFDLGEEIIRTLVPPLSGREVLELHARWGQGLRGAGAVVSADGRISLAGGPSIGPRAFFDLATGPSERFERFRQASPMIARLPRADLGQATAAQIDQVAEAMAARISGDGARTRAAMTALKASGDPSLPRLANEAADLELAAVPRARMRAKAPVAADAPAVDAGMRAVTDWLDAPAHARANGPKPHAASFFGNASVPRDLRLAIAARVERAHASDRFEADALRRWAARLDEAARGRYADEALRLRAIEETTAEIDHALAVVRRGDVADGSVVVMSAKPKNVYQLSPAKRFDFRSVNGEEILSEGDLLYLGKDGKVHIDEVKRTANALATKIAEGGGDINGRSIYLARMQEWQRQSPEHVARIAVMEESTWARVTDKVPGMDRSAIELCNHHGIQLEVAGHAFTASEWRTIQRRLRAEPALRNSAPERILER